MATYSNYERIGWENAPSEKTPLNADNLNHMDAGIGENRTAIQNLNSAINAMNAADIEKIAEAASMASRAESAAETAEAVVGIGIATTQKAGIVKPDGNSVLVSDGGLLSVDMTMVNAHEAQLSGFHFRVENGEKQVSADGVNWESFKSGGAAVRLIKAATFTRASNTVATFDIKGMIPDYADLTIERIIVQTRSRRQPSTSSGVTVTMSYAYDNGIITATASGATITPSSTYPYNADIYIIPADDEIEEV